ncbi:hypothetical protein E2C01_058143 [Portunus trituberculatus]|uniref:Uncharacterized protein n=1 Tax=Portunus trituberculatus TaxID=210409 RepID=A0A5B7H1V3_PORTR|nr:hypothetical protein [Portunus trituberculatus]
MLLLFNIPLILISDLQDCWVTSLITRRKATDTHLSTSCSCIDQTEGGMESWMICASTAPPSIRTKAQVFVNKFSSNTVDVSSGLVRLS